MSHDPYTKLPEPVEFDNDPSRHPRPGQLEIAMGNYIKDMDKAVKLFSGTQLELIAAHSSDERERAWARLMLGARA